MLRDVFMLKTFIKYLDSSFFEKKSSVELPFSSFGDNLINILRKVNRLIYAFKIN
jgi:hypothetical protein